jgi:hypothetical protein
MQEEIAEVNETRANHSGVASDQNSSSASDNSESVSFDDFILGWLLLGLVGGGREAMEAHTVASAVVKMIKKLQNDLDT